MAQIGTTVLAEVNLDIRRGSDCSWVLVYSQQDIAGGVVPNTFAGWTARSQIRQRVGGDLWLTQTITLTPAGNRLTVTGHIPAVVTEAAMWDSRSLGVWDVELVRADGSVIPLAGGRVLVTADVTRV